MTTMKALQRGTAKIRGAVHRAAVALEQRTAPPPPEEQPVVQEQEPVCADTQFVSLVFDDEAEYVRFTDYVYSSFGGRALHFTDMPQLYTVRVTLGLFKACQDQFVMHQATESEMAAARGLYENRQPFSEKTLDEFLGPKAGTEKLGR